VREDEDEDVSTYWMTLRKTRGVYITIFKLIHSTFYAVNFTL